MIRLRFEPAAPRPFVTPELSSLRRASVPSGRLAKQSVNVPPTSIQNSQGCCCMDAAAVARGPSCLSPLPLGEAG